MEKKYRLCFLGYRNLTSLAASALSSLDLPDTDVRLEDCNVETLQSTVDKALADGYEFFIAGSANAAEFRRHYSAHLVEINLRPVDYLSAVKKAMQIGSRPVLAMYRYGRPVDLALLKDLSGAPLETFYYEDSAGLQEGILGASGDVILGAGHANELAAELGKKSVLLYPGEDSIKSAIRRARNLAVELEREMQRSRIIRSIIGDAPIGLIVTNTDGNITLFNRAARGYTMIGPVNVQGKPLADLLPMLSPEEFLRSGEKESDQRKLINGAMMRCVRVRIQDRDRVVGVLTTLYPDNSRRSREELEAAERFKAHGSWKDVIGDSPAIKTLVREAKLVSESDLPLTILGESGTGKTFYARCIHNASARAKAPCITVNVSSLPDQEIARVLFGTEDGDAVRPGLLELAGKGTVILRGLPLASKVVQNALLQAFEDRSFIRLGGMAPVPFLARPITILDAGQQEDADEAAPGIIGPLRYLLSVLSIRVPPLRDRVEDIPALFHYLSTQEGEDTSSERKRALKASDEVLQYYSWPGNLFELSAVCKRYAYLLSLESRLTPNSRHLLLLQAIGEEKLFREILRRHPALADISGTADAEIGTADTKGGKKAARYTAAPDGSKDILAGIEDMKHILKYNNDTIAQKLSIGRTTLWRLTKGITDTSE